MSTIAHSSKYIVKWVVIKASLCISEHQKHELEKIGFVRMGLYDSSERVVAKHYANMEEVRADADDIKKAYTILMKTRGRKPQELAGCVVSDAQFGKMDFKDVQGLWTAKGVENFKAIIE